MRSLISMCLAGILSTGSATAAEMCEYCSSNEMFNLGQQVVTRGAWNEQHPAVYVTNFADGTVVKVAYGHNVNQNFDWENDLFESWGINVPVEPYVTQYLAAMHAAMPAPVEMGAGTSSAARVKLAAETDNIPDSIYDSISTSSYDTPISIRLDTSAAGLRQAFVSYLQVSNPLPNFNPNASAPPVRANFQDGTFAYYRWDISTQQWNRIPGSARDKFGNKIPETAADVAGSGSANYLFPNGDGTELASFLYRLNDLGVSVGTAGGSGTRVKIACSSAAGGTPVCEVVIY